MSKKENCEKTATEDCHRGLIKCCHFENFIKISNKYLNSELKISLKFLISILILNHFVWVIQKGNAFCDSAFSDKNEHFSP